jgi:uncharacterized protein (DUF488 family)
MRAITTIGCEGASPERFDDVLSAARIDVLVDVRAGAISLRKGFSSDALAARMNASGRTYVRLRDLEQIGDLARLTDGHRVALMGYQADAADCRRSAVAEEVADLENLAILHLRVAKVQESGGWAGAAHDLGQHLAAA